MRRPSFQFYPADWRGNANLRRCSLEARGAWIEVICILHDSDEYGVCRWNLEEISTASGVKIKILRELVEKKVLKGSDTGIEPFTHTTRHAGQNGETFVLIENTNEPCWFSSRMVTDEWIRSRRGGETRFKPKAPPTESPTARVGDGLGDGPTSSSSSTSTKTIRRVATAPVVLPFEDSEFALLWAKWIDHLGQKKKKPTTHAIDLQLVKLQAYGRDKAVKSILQSIQNNWQGLFEPSEPKANGFLSVKKTDKVW